MRAWCTAFAAKEVLRYHVEDIMAKKMMHSFRKWRQTAHRNRERRRAKQMVESKRRKRNSMTQWVAYYERCCYRKKEERAAANQRAREAFMRISLHRLANRVRWSKVERGMKIAELEKRHRWVTDGSGMLISTLITLMVGVG